MKLKTRIALHGKLRRGNIWTYDQLCSMLTKFLGQAPSQLNKDLADETVYSATLKLCKDFFARVGEILPLHLLDVDNFLEVHENSMFTKAIFATGLGYVGRSIVDEMMIDESMTWESALKTMDSLEAPMVSKADKFWQAAKVCMMDEGKIKIIKGTDKRIGSIICRELRIYPCKDLGA